jgi:hypothetical protein
MQNRYPHNMYRMHVLADAQSATQYTRCSMFKMLQRNDPFHPFSNAALSIIAEAYMIRHGAPKLATNGATAASVMMFELGFFSPSLALSTVGSSRPFCSTLSG